jgi:hypothetical protein
MKWSGFMINLAMMPEQDELLYSWLKKIYILNGCLNIFDFKKDMFKNQDISINLLYSVPINKMDIHSSFLNEETKKELLLNHTIYPLAIPFVKKENKQRVYEGFLNSDMHLKRLCNTHRDNLFLNDEKVIKYCPLCIKERDSRDFLPINRNHNFPGVKVCYEHGCYLNEIQASYRKSNQLYMLSHKFLEETRFPTNELIHKHLKVANTSKSIMDGSLLDFDFELVMSKYKNKLHELGIHVTPKLAEDVLIKQFIKYYGNNFLKEYESEVDNVELNWLRSLLYYQNFEQTPLRHILVINFLFESLSDFINSGNEYLPIGTPPFECINSKCTCHKLKVADEYYVKYKKEFMYNYIRCKHCGFEYIIIINGDTQQIRIKDYGFIWEENLRERVINGNSSIPKLIEEFNCGREKLINTIVKLGLEEYLNLKVEKNTNVKRVDYEVYRKNVLTYISNNPGCTKNDIRINLAKEYTTLIKYDKEWYDALFPNNKNVNLDRYDVEYWLKKDLEISH